MLLISALHILRHRCDDPEVDNFGSKWSFSALLRHLKSKGVDTKGTARVNPSFSLFCDLSFST